MLKRLLPLLLSGLLAFSLSACSGSTGSSDTTIDANSSDNTAEASDSNEASTASDSSTSNNNSNNNSDNNSYSDTGNSVTIPALLNTLGDPDKTYGTTFGQGSVTEINVDIKEDDWNDLQNNASKEEYYSADITINGTTVSNVGFRTKGFSSLMSVSNSDSDRYGFKVKFDQYVDKQSLNGLDTLVLNASFADPSYMREFLTYAANSYLGGITPYVSYCNLSINGELFGFYLCIEAYDDSFVERNTASEDAVLYKAVSENCTLLTNDDGSGFDVDYGEDDDYSNIKSLIQVLNSTTEENKADLEAILDIDSVLKAIAANTVMGNYDSYSGSKAHNYYLLYSDGQFSYIGWDYNMSIGGFSEDGGASVTVDVASPVYNVDISQRPLIQKLLAIDEYYERYLGYLSSLTGYLSNFQSNVNELAEQIRPNVANDPSAFYTIDQFETSIAISDTDLTQVQNRLGGFRDSNNFPRGNNQGTPPDFAGYAPTDGDFPQLPDGAYFPNMQGGQQFPGSRGNDDIDAASGATPNYGDTTQGYLDNSQSFPGGSFPDFSKGDNNRMGGMGNMISQTTVSIVDYITQRLEQINSQLKEK